MTLQELMEIVRRYDEKKPVGELAIEVTGYYRDICNTIEPLISSQELQTDGVKTEFEYTDFDQSIMDVFMKLRSVWKDGTPLRESNGAIAGDDCYRQTLTGIIAGVMDHESNIKPFPSGKMIEIVFHSYPPKVTVATEVLPFPWADQMILAQAKATIYAEKRQWDRAGYFNRKYENSLLHYRRMFQSSGPQRTIHTNDRIQ